MQKFFALLAFATVCSAQFAAFPYSAFAPYGVSHMVDPFKTYAYPYSMYSVIAPRVVPAPVAVAAPVEFKTQYHIQDAFVGAAKYGSIEADKVHEAVQDAAGNKVGSFSHVLADGTIAKTDYVADAMGYRVASNVLPVQTAAPVADTAEVAAARAAHLAEYEKVKMRNKRDLYSTGLVSGAYMHPFYQPYVNNYYRTYAPYAGYYNTHFANQFYHY